MMDDSQHPVIYDRYGRMQYHPNFHGKQKSAWTTSEEKYLVENYSTAGPEQVSLALGRTIHTVMTRACKLRKAGLMTKPAKRVNTHRSGASSSRGATC